MPRAAFVYTDAFTTYHFGSSHPLQQTRLRMTHRLLEAYGAFDAPNSDLIPPAPATYGRSIRRIIWRLCAG